MTPLQAEMARQAFGFASQGVDRRAARRFMTDKYGTSAPGDIQLALDMAYNAVNAAKDARSGNYTSFSEIRRLQDAGDMLRVRVYYHLEGGPRTVEGVVDVIAPSVASIVAVQEYVREYIDRQAAENNFGSDVPDYDRHAGENIVSIQSIQPMLASFSTAGTTLGGLAG